MQVKMTIGKCVMFINGGLKKATRIMTGIVMLNSEQMKVEVLIRVVQKASHVP